MSQPDEDSDTEEQKYQQFSRIGFLRNMNQNLIDIEQIPKRNKADKFMSADNDRDSSDQMRELFATKYKLAKKGIYSDLKDIELGLITLDSIKSPISPYTFPRGGESLIANPLISLKEKSKKQKKKSKKKKNINK